MSPPDMILSPADFIFEEWFRERRRETWFKNCVIGDPHEPPEGWSLGLKGTYRAAWDGAVARLQGDLVEALRKIAHAKYDDGSKMTAPCMRNIACKTLYDLGLLARPLTSPKEVPPLPREKSEAQSEAEIKCSVPPKAANE